MKRRLTIFLVIAVTMSLGVAAIAEAHVLPAKIAGKAARKFGKKVGQAYIDEFPNRAKDARYKVDPCSRRTDHRFVCKLHVFGTDTDTGQDYDCHSFIIVQAAKNDFTYTTKLTDVQPGC